MTRPAVFESDLIRCARCKGDHRGLIFRPFTFPANVGDGRTPVYTHWATCPTTKEPIMLFHGAFLKAEEA